MHRRNAVATVAATVASLGHETTRAQVEVGTTPVPVVPIPPADGPGTDVGPIRCALGVCVPGNVRFNFTTGQLFAQARDCC